MNKVILYCVCAAAVAAVAFSVIAVLLYRRKTRRVLESLSKMIDDAVSGEFSEKSFDESLLSAVETKLAHYLASSEVSAKNITAEKNKIKELIGDISHQTKTPVANILLYSQLLAEQELSPQAKDCAEQLDAQADKLRFLIDALVKTSRLETGVLSLCPERSEVSQLMHTAIAQNRPAAEEKHIELRCRDTDCYAVFDPKWTAEALYNLLDNAVKYTPCGGSITVEATQYELFCKITVTDTGIGIADSEQAKVFSRFYRSPAVSHEQGVGIGLYLTRQIAAAQGGYIKLESKPGEGSAFSLFLPTAG